VEPPLSSHSHLGPSTLVSVRILVVEDDVRMAGLLKRGLEEEGYAVDVAPNGEDGVWLGTENEYDAVVLPTGLPASTPGPTTT
jgi:DNA-binding response OmpR family regulator